MFKFLVQVRASLSIVRRASCALGSFLSIATLCAFLPYQTNAQELHLKASYAKPITTADPNSTTAVYREIVVRKNPKGAYSTMTFKGGYIGPANGYADNPAGAHINFSIWDQDGNEAQLYESSTLGNPDNHRFGHEGSGYHCELDYDWVLNVRYKFLVKVEHVGGATIWSGFFGLADSEEWFLCGRIIVDNVTLYLGKPGGFLEHVGKKNPNLVRRTGFGPGWVRDNSGWIPSTGIKYTYKDGNTSNASVADANTLNLMIQNNLQNQWNSPHSFALVPRRTTAPSDPDSGGGGSGNYSTIEHHASGLNLNADSSGSSLGLSAGTGSDFKWKLVDTGDGWNRLEHKSSGEWLKSNSSGSTPTLVGTGNTGNGTKWRQVDAGDGWVRLENKASGMWLHSTPNGGTLSVVPTTQTGNYTRWRM